MTVTDGTTEGNREAPTVASVSTKAGEPSLKQLTIDWKVKDKHAELLHFGMEVKNFLMAKSYDIPDSERVLIVMNWLGCEELN